MARMKFYSLWLILICIILFILQISFNWFTDLFVLNPLSYTQIWRFVTAIFLHGRITHLLYNVLALFFFGIALEKLIGSNRFLLVYLGSGIVANIISVNFYPSSLGASGAIMGIIGCLTIIKPFMMVWAFGLILPMFIASILWVIGDVLGIFFPSGIGNIAHLFGIAVGILVGLILREWRTTKKELMKVPEGYMRLWERRYMK